MEQKLTGRTFHMVAREYYDAQPIDQDYQPEPMAAGQEEFIHTTTGPQNMVDTAHRYYRNDPRRYYLLVIDLDKVNAPTRYDDPNQIYPHIYGPLNRDAILEVRNFERASDGTFLLPDPA